MFQKIQEPSRERLLPDPLEYPYIQPPYTLCLEMNNVLVNPEWTVSSYHNFPVNENKKLHLINPKGKFILLMQEQRQGPLFKVSSERLV